MQIRHAQAHDADAIAYVHHISRQKAYKGIMPDDYLQLRSLADRKTQWQENVAKSLNGEVVIFVVEEDGDVYGFACLGPTKDNDLNKEKSGELYALYLAPEIWGEGYGKQLMQHSINEAIRRGFSDCRVWVYESNARARNFYQSSGFNVDGAERQVEGGYPLKVVRYSLPLEARIPV
jgi:GNAT superfamily N-acetyltransferase